MKKLISIVVILFAFIGCNDKAFYPQENINIANENLVDFCIMLKTNPHAKEFSEYALTNSFKYVGEGVLFNEPNVIFLKFKRVRFK